MTQREIGFVGLGRMGFPMARNLAQAGYRVHAHDIAPEAMRRASAVPCPGLWRSSPGVGRVW